MVLGRIVSEDRAMKTLPLLFLLLAAAAQADEQVIKVQHDSVRGVTCYILRDVSISCVPDTQIRAEPKKTKADAPVVTEGWSM